MFEQNLTLRMNLLGGMNEFVKTSIPSEFYIDLWQSECIPVEATEKDLEILASSDEFFTHCIHTFDFICLRCL